MRKLWILSAMLLCVLLSGCCLSHDWQEADCVSPRTCAKCEEIEGKALGHDWQKAACETAQICTRCAEVQGEPLGHSWTEATCAEGSVCSVCGAEGEAALDHDIRNISMEENTYTGECKRCGKEIVETVEDWAAFAPRLAVGRKPAAILMEMDLAGNITTKGLPEEEYLELTEDGEATLFFEGITYTGTWRYDKYALIESWGEQIYRFHYLMDIGLEEEIQVNLLGSSPNTLTVGWEGVEIAIFSEDESMVSNAQKLREKQAAEAAGEGS